MAETKSAPTARLHIDTLSLRVPGRDAASGARLAKNIAERLSESQELGASGRIERLDVRVRAPRRGGQAALAAEVTNAVLRTLRRT